MILTFLSLVMLLTGCGVLSADLNSVLGRLNCYKKEQAGCSQDFIDAYPHLSRSATNLTYADTYFWLFTRKNPKEPENLHKCAGKLPPNTNFNPSDELIVILTPFIAGFCDVAIYREWLNEILKKGNYNVLVVDYSWGNHLDYGGAIVNIRIVANQTVIVLKNIQEETGITKDKITMVGHSLGAQLAGLIGRDFPVKRITGLDPAGPGFATEETPPENRLDPTDADFVDVWHCNAGRCLPDLGTVGDVGHVNFYINGGSVQPACHKYALISLIKGDLVYGLGTAISPQTCYHAFCAKYYKVAINPGNCQFTGVKCESYEDFKSGKCRRCGRNGENCLIMGFDTDKYVKNNISSPEKFYLDTTKECPYCGNRNGHLG